MTECVVCCKKIDVMESYNGEQMCQECYHSKENYVFGIDGEGADDE